MVEHIQQYRLTGKFVNFLLTIAVNTCNNHFKKKSADTVDMDTLADFPSNLNVSEESCGKRTLKSYSKPLIGSPIYKKRL